MKTNIKILFILSIMVISLLAGNVTAVTAVTAGTGSVYMERYKKLEKKCKKKFKYDAPQLVMNRQSAKEYKLWDKELNYVYKKIYSKLNTSKKEELKKSEIAWIKKRDKKAEKSASEFERGSMYPQVYNGKLVQLTKKRIKWIINNYEP